MRFLAYRLGMTRVKKGTNQARHEGTYKRLCADKPHLRFLS